MGVKGQKDTAWFAMQAGKLIYASWSRPLAFASSGKTCRTLLAAFFNVSPTQT